jgi:hypothetical protein
MCKIYETALVPIPDFIKADPLCSSADRPEVFDGGEYAIDDKGRECFVIDACLVPALQALWDAGVKTSGSCCGHGSGSGVIGLITDYNRHMKHISEAPPYQLVEVVERRRHENAAYERGRRDGLVEAGREDLLPSPPESTGETEKQDG